MALVIRKKITCEFLGEEYKDAYLTFKAIPISQLAEVQKTLPKGDDEESNIKTIPVMLDILKKYFLNGKFPDEKGELADVTQEDLDDITTDLALHCFEGLTGVETNLEPPSANS